MFEFETTVGGKHLNGVEIGRCDETGHIVAHRLADVVDGRQAPDHHPAMLASMQPQLHPNER